MVVDGQISFKDRLKTRPLIFTAIPLRDNKTGDPKHDDKILKNLETRKEELRKSLENSSRLTAISVPELVEENHEGKPRYNSIYTRALSRGVADLLHVDSIVNKVIAHAESFEKFVEWMMETSSLGISNIIFVGGNTRHHRYPGPTVSEANIIATHLSRKHPPWDITIGNISLPERAEEAKRMLFKTIAGAQFFTTQMLFTDKQIIDLLLDYGKQCSKAGIEPATVILSFAPLRGTADLNLLDFLGVDLPYSAESYILEKGESSDAINRSILNSLAIYRKVVAVMEELKSYVPIGINVEQLTKSNLNASVEMLNFFERAIDMKSEEIAELISTIKV